MQYIWPAQVFVAIFVFSYPSIMKISGFTFTKNASKLYYPVKESILSILPLVDEMIVVIGDCDEDDSTEMLIKSIQSDKIKVIHTVWDLEKFPNGMEYARQTDIAKNACTGDWLFYLQSDEVVHEKYLPLINKKCHQFIDDKEVEGFLFKYKHFWGDYEHYVNSHAIYPREIRIIRNDPKIHSWRDAQSFRRIPHFDGMNYYQKEGTSKLRVIELEAYIFHYGFVRPPHLMQKKRRNHFANYNGEIFAGQLFQEEPADFDYGNLSRLSTYKDTPPSVMREFISRFNWKEQLCYTKTNKQLTRHKHEKIKYRLLTAIENLFLNGHLLFGFKNYRRIRK